MSEPQSKNSVLVSVQGVRAYCALLSLLGLPRVGLTISNEIFDLAKAGRTLNRATAIDKIIAKKPQPVSELALKKFFAGLIEEVKKGYKYGADQITAPEEINYRKTIIKDLELLEYYNYSDQDIREKKNWKVPECFYETVPLSPDQKKLCSEVVKALCLLNYSDQKKQFRDSMNRYSIFSVEAPETQSQQWLMFSLLQKFKENTYQTFYIRMDDNLIKSRIDYDDFVEKFLRKSVAETIESFLESNYNTKIIMIIHGFRSRKDIQKSFFTDLWQSLSTQSTENKSRVKVFWLDEVLPYFLVNEQAIDDWEEGIKSMTCILKPLTEINNVHIDDWVDNSSSAFKLLNKLGTANQLVNDEIEWQNPGIILDKICCKLDVIGGIETIRKQWKLTL